MEEINLIFANKLQELRRDNNVKQGILAKELNISQQAYSKLERGRLNFTPIILKKICLFFNISIHDFLNTGRQVKILNSPQANTQHSFNNDSGIVQELLKSKNDTIESLKAQNILLEKFNTQLTNRISVLEKK